MHGHQFPTVITMWLNMLVAVFASSAASASSAAATQFGRTRSLPTIMQARPQGTAQLPSSADCTWKHYTQPLSHFAEGSTAVGNATFTQRVCIIDKYWKAPAAELLPAAGGKVKFTGLTQNSQIDPAV
jgi:hypothetical protein